MEFVLCLREVGVRAQAKRKVSARDPILGGSFGPKLLPRTREKIMGVLPEARRLIRKVYQGTSNPNLPQM